MGNRKSSKTSEEWEHGCLPRSIPDAYDKYKCPGAGVKFIISTIQPLPTTTARKMGLTHLLNLSLVVFSSCN